MTGVPPPPFRAGPQKKDKVKRRPDWARRQYESKLDDLYAQAVRMECDMGQFCFGAGTIYAQIPPDDLDGIVRAMDKAKKHVRRAQKRLGRLLDARDAQRAERIRQMKEEADRHGGA